MIRRAIAFFFDILQTIVLAAAIFVIIYLFVAQPHRVQGSSMEPNFLNSDYILTEKVSYRLSEPRRGDVVVFEAPNRANADYIKRIIALPNEVMHVSDGVVYVNDQPLPETYEPESQRTSPGSFLKEGADYTVPSDTYIVLGDNRPHSSDSREFGPIERDSIVGRAIFRYWPPERMGKFKSPEY